MVVIMSWWSCGSGVQVLVVVMCWWWSSDGGGGISIYKFNSRISISKYMKTDDSGDDALLPQFY